MRWLRRLFRTRYHHRSQGPVRIDPDTNGTVHVWGRP